MKNGFAKVVSLLLIGVMAVISLMGCSSTTTAAPSTVTVTDVAGHNCTVSSPVQNIMVIPGAAYERVVMLGAEDRIAAAADWYLTGEAWAHVIYKRLDSVPVLSNPSTPNIETLLNYDPGVVFWFSNDQNVEAMENAGIPVYCMIGDGMNTLVSLKDQLMGFAQIIGPDAVKIAEEYNTYFDKIYNRVTAITSTIPETQKPKVYVTSGIPLRTRGGTCETRDTVEKAGGIYIAKDAAQGNNNISYEQMMEWNPDIIIIDHAPDLPDPSASATSNTPNGNEVYEQIMSDPQLQAINAVKNHQVYVSPMGEYFWDNTGQQGILQLEWMAQIFYPDKFKDLNMSTELKDFYTKFFSYNLTDEEATLILAHKLPPGAEKWGY